MDGGRGRLQSRAPASLGRQSLAWVSLGWPPLQLVQAAEADPRAPTPRVPSCPPPGGVRGTGGDGEEAGLPWVPGGAGTGRRGQSGRAGGGSHVRFGSRRGRSLGLGSGRGAWPLWGQLGGEGATSGGTAGAKGASGWEGRGDPMVPSTPPRRALRSCLRPGQRGPSTQEEAKAQRSHRRMKACARHPGPGCGLCGQWAGQGVGEASLPLPGPGGPQRRCVQGWAGRGRCGVNRTAPGVAQGLLVAEAWPEGLSLSRGGRRGEGGPRCPPHPTSP